MPISALPHSTARLLGSSVAITTPCGLVKELIDNAIDAKATSVEVIISANTIDKIQVRDDGHGIDMDDFDALGRRAHTSKLRKFDELREIGGQTLGFRGEALTSANILSTVTITTRTKNDPVASRMQLRLGDGGVQDIRPVSAPVGTTVQATNLFERLLVRKRFALKEAHKAMTRIKDLLSGYALARPYLKLSFKISGDTKSSWSYAPNQSPNVREAVLQLFGKNLASNCVETAQFSGTGDETPSRECDLPAEFIIEAFMPRSGSNAEAVRGKGAFISVDSRPLSSTSEFAKKLVSIFKLQFSESLGTESSNKLPVNSFMQLNVRCPPGSYDPNVAPLKDEVLFGDATTVLDCFETLCREIYTREKPTTDEQDDVASNAIGVYDVRASESVAYEKSSTIAQSRSPDQARNIATDQEDDDFSDAFVLDDADALDILEAIESTDLPSGPARQTLGLSDLPKELSEQPAFHHTQCSTQLLRKEQQLTRRSDNDPCDGNALLPAKMRTVKPINMARMESSTTDENSIAGLIDVQVPPRCASPETAHATQPQPRVLPSQPTASCRTDDIERYFERNQNESFQVATDETATVGDCEPPGSSTEWPNLGSNGTCRQPLVPLSDSDLNRMRGGAELEENSSETEPEILQPYRNPAGTFGGRFVNRHQGDIQNPGSRIHSPFPSSDSPVRERLLQQADSTPRRWAPGNQSLETPPPSDQLHRERAANPAFRPPQMNHVLAGGLGQEQQRNRRAVVRADPNPNRRNVNGTVSRRMNRGPETIERQHRRSPRTRVDDTTLLSGRVQENEPATEYNSPQRPPHEPLQAASRHQDISAIHAEEAEPQGDGHYSHTSQVLLMRTPPPVTSVRTQITEELHIGGRHLSDISGTANPWHSIALLDRNISMSRNSATSEQDGDARRYLMRRQRSQARCGRPRRLCSRKLPLETVPAEERTKSISMTVQLQLRDLENWTQIWVNLEPHTSTRDLENSLQFKHMPEAQLVEQRLRAVVDSWASTRGMEMEVEYTLVRGAKGKGRA